MYMHIAAQLLSPKTDEIMNNTVFTVEPVHCGHAPGDTIHVQCTMHVSHTVHIHCTVYRIIKELYMLKTKVNVHEHTLRKNNCLKNSLYF